MPRDALQDRQGLIRLSRDCWLYLKVPLADDLCHGLSLILARPFHTDFLLFQFNLGFAGGHQLLRIHVHFHRNGLLLLRMFATVVNRFIRLHSSPLVVDLGNQV